MTWDKQGSKKRLDGLLLDSIVSTTKQEKAGLCLSIRGAVLELLRAEIRDMNSFRGRNLSPVSKNLLLS